jgi:putative transposase
MKIPIDSGLKALRRGRASAPNQIYFVTMVCHERRRLFLNWETAVCASQILHQASLWQDSKLLCWVLMQNHWHGLVQLGSDETLSKLMQRVKAVSAKVINESLNMTQACSNQHLSYKNKGAVWQKGFYDHALRTEESIRSVAEYIIANPLRANLVKDIGHYPFWDAYWLSHNGEVV